MPLNKSEPTCNCSNSLTLIAMSYRSIMIVCKTRPLGVSQMPIQNKKMKVVVNSTPFCYNVLVGPRWWPLRYESSLVEKRVKASSLTRQFVPA